ncbi:phosphogluconate dehydratase [Terricaulis sp.]|uniref:phosphogluconate dehydratase n=1 Tax=Terricaulis sp. TaxID=2768686 RepID=UPI002AC45A95|nr:phosphogluconate dehydratase [Terricaulis sp.]MDZ4692215.1 phosphogluconate dehydratase [Terricaulis sp.]
MAQLNSTIEAVTERIRVRSAKRRQRYLDLISAHDVSKPARLRLAEANQAHTAAGCAVQDKMQLLGGKWPSIGIVTAYNDMLSAHAPYERFPDIIRKAARERGAIAQVAGGVPAMCDGVTQGFEGMELSLFSRDVIALSTGVSLSHATFDATLLLGICDKIVPGLLIGALRFPWLPAIFVPGGPMPSGLPNKEKAARRQLFAEGKIGREELLQVEAESYHSPGTCTFYGTANSNQMMMELMGLHLPNAAFVNPNTPLRDALTVAATHRAAEITGLGDDYRPIGHVVDERAIVNAIVGLMATGGSTNHFIHLPAIALAAGIELLWDDFGDVARVTPLLAKIYPNGGADVNNFRDAGGMAFVTRELLGAGLLHGEILTVSRDGMDGHTRDPGLDGDALVWRNAPLLPGDDTIVRPMSDPFSATGGLVVMSGGLGRGCAKTSAVGAPFLTVEAPAAVFASQAEVQAAFRAGDLDRDCVIVVRGQGPRANGMPELHKLMPLMGALQDRGFKVALVTDGRMSGASGKVLAAIHVTPEAAEGGPLAKVRNGDVIRVDGEHGALDVVSPPDWRERAPAQLDLAGNARGMGRELFSLFRLHACSAERGGSAFPDYDPI